MQDLRISLLLACASTTLLCTAASVGKYDPCNTPGLATRVRQQTIPLLIKSMCLVHTYQFPLHACTAQKMQSALGWLSSISHKPVHGSAELAQCGLYISAVKAALMDLVFHHSALNIHSYKSISTRCIQNGPRGSGPQTFRQARDMYFAVQRARASCVCTARDKASTWAWRCGRAAPRSTGSQHTLPSRACTGSTPATSQAHTTALASPTAHSWCCGSQTGVTSTLAI